MAEKYIDSVCVSYYRSENLIKKMSDTELMSYKPKEKKNWTK